jgi:hypothetical protein
MRLARVRRLAVVITAVAALLALSVCGQRTATLEDLQQVLKDAHSALSTSLLALDQLERGRATKAVVQTALEDMSKEVSTAQHTIDQIKIGSDLDREDRNATSTAVTGAAIALMEARDELDLHGGLVDRQALQAADEEINALLDRVRAGR